MNVRASSAADHAPLDPAGAELELLIEDIYRTLHQDFRGYARAALARRAQRAATAQGCGSLIELLARGRRDPAALAAAVPFLTLQVGDLFRDPAHYRTLREQVLPFLATWPFIRIWVAGCGNGEEVHSIAILLHEAGLLERSRIYATDISEEALRRAERGAYPLERLRAFSENYYAAGGRGSLADYYTTTAAEAVFAPELRRGVVFSDHSLATDAVFAEVQLVSCRNVLIYFGRELKERALGLFREALCPGGVLGLGARESLRLSTHAPAFERLGADRLWRRR
jgi:chemotaxis protein methyltransferase CheR